MWTVNLQMFKLDLEKVEEPEIKLPTSAESSRKKDSSRKTSTLLYNMLSKLVITLLPGSKHFFISWLQSPSAVILEHKK